MKGEIIACERPELGEAVEEYVGWDLDAGFGEEEDVARGKKREREKGEESRGEEDDVERSVRGARERDDGRWGRR